MPELNLSSLSASFRCPALTTRMAVTLDEVSRGRRSLGMSAGWRDPEYDAPGLPTDHAVQDAGRDEEAII